MADVFTKEKRSEIMSKIKSKDTKPELIVRKAVFKMGYRYRKNDKRYPGRPDIYLPKCKTAIFINGCFWHRHINCKYAQNPKSNKLFWQQKITNNIKRDNKNYKQLLNMGIEVIVIWECEVRTDLENTINKLKHKLETIKEKNN